MTPRAHIGTEAQHQGANRIKGLDSLRFWCALWVVVGHFGFLPLIDGVDLTHAAGRVSRAVYDNLTSGPAAVIVFFVISGFCIHYPFRRAATVPLVPFFARRYLRILIPVAVAIGISRPVGVELRLLQKGVLWSLICEEIYYALYPLLLRLRMRFGWRRLIVFSYVVSVLIALTNLRAGDYPSYGPGANWLLGLPCWLLGCDLAESYSREPKKATDGVPIAWWRVGAGFSQCSRVFCDFTPLLRIRLHSTFSLFTSTSGCAKK